MLSKAWLIHVLPANANQSEFNVQLTSQLCFRCQYSQELSTAQLLRIIRCEFMTSTFASHSHCQKYKPGFGLFCQGRSSRCYYLINVYRKQECILLFYFIYLYIDFPSCAPGEFQCKYGSCINESQVCNAEIDCYDGGSDESNCSKSSTF